MSPGRVLVAVLVSLAVLPAAARADRLDRIAGELRRDTVVVDDDLRDAFPPAVATAVRRAIADVRAEVDVRLVALPLVEADESGGEADRVFWGLEDRLPRRPRVLVVVDQRGTAELYALRTGREFRGFYDDLYGGAREDADALAARMVRLVELVDAAPPGEARVPERPDGPPDPVRDRRPADDEQDGNALAGVAIIWVFCAVAGAVTAIRRRPRRRRSRT